MQEKEYKIYTLAHPITDEIRYIGFTSTELKYRLNGHCHQTNKTPNNKRENWMRNLLAQGLRPKIELLEIVSKENWQEKEIYWIAQFKAWNFRLVNASAGGDKCNLGLKRADSWASPKEKAVNQYDLNGNFIKSWRSQSKAGNALNITIDTIGRACRNRLTASNYQWRFTDDNTPVTKWTGKVNRKISQYTLNNEYMKDWNSCAAAAKFLNIAPNNIQEIVKGRNSTSGGFKWKYSEFV